MIPDNPTDFFWNVATPFLAQEGVTRSTMMGFPCLRLKGDYFASAHHKTGDLIVKLPANRVLDLIEQEVGEPFAPNGRRFREWLAVPRRDANLWRQLIADAQTFVGDRQS